MNEIMCVYAYQASCRIGPPNCAVQIKSNLAHLADCCAPFHLIFTLFISSKSQTIGTAAVAVASLMGDSLNKEAAAGAAVVLTIVFLVFNCIEITGSQALFAQRLFVEQSQKKVAKRQPKTIIIIAEFVNASFSRVPARLLTVCSIDDVERSLSSTARWRLR